MLFARELVVPLQRAMRVESRSANTLLNLLAVVCALEQPTPFTESVRVEKTANVQLYNHPNHASSVTVIADSVTQDALCP